MVTAPQSGSICPLSLLHIAVRGCFFDEAFGAFVDAIDESLSSDIGRQLDNDIEDLSRLSQLRRQVVGSLIDELDDDSEVGVFAIYIRSVMARVAGNDKRLPDVLQLFRDEFYGLLAICDKAHATQGLPHVDARAQWENYFLAWARAPFHFELESWLLAPLIYWLYLPFAPWSRSTELIACMRRTVQAHGICPYPRLAASMNSAGITCRLPLLQNFAANDPSLLHVSAGGQWRVGMAEKLLPSFQCAAFHIDPRAYMPDAAGPNDKYDQADRVKAASSFEGRIRQRFVQLEGTAELPPVDWNEVVLKLIQVRKSSCEDKLQGLLGRSLHAAIVRKLAAKRRAMTRAQLERELGVRIPLSPADLGPGCIMAYARHPRFLKPEEAFYVLGNWVETDTQKRGKIPRAHIVTPFIAKDTSFSDRQLWDLIEEDALYVRYRIVSSRRIALRLAPLLPDRPVELYFVTRITADVEKRVRKHLADLGNGYFTRSANLDGIDISLDKKEIRRRVLSRILGSPLGLDEALNAVDDPEVRKELRALLR